MSLMSPGTLARVSKLTRQRTEEVNDRFDRDRQIIENGNGFDNDGFDFDGFDRQGFDREGFDRYGFNRKGFDREGYDVNGVDRYGFDRDANFVGRTR